MSPADVRRYAHEAIVREEGRYRVTPSDSAYQRMPVLSTEGLRDVDTRGVTGSLVGQRPLERHRPIRLNRRRRSPPSVSSASEWVEWNLLPTRI